LSTWNLKSLQFKAWKQQKKLTGMRWWMVGLVTADLIVDYLASNPLSVAAPTAHCCCARAS
jgi:hypothetical protein